MKIGSLVRNKSFPNAQCFGIVVKIYSSDVRIHWVKLGISNLWGRYSDSLEVLCE